MSPPTPSPVEADADGDGDGDGEAIAEGTTTTTMPVDDRRPARAPGDATMDIDDDHDAATMAAAANASSSSPPIRPPTSAPPPSTSNSDLNSNSPDEDEDAAAEERQRPERGGVKRMERVDDDGEEDGCWLSALPIAHRGLRVCRPRRACAAPTPARLEWRGERDWPDDNYDRDRPPTFCFRRSASPGRKSQRPLPIEPTVRESRIRRTRRQEVEQVFDPVSIAEQKVYVLDSKRRDAVEVLSSHGSRV